MPETPEPSQAPAARTPPAGRFGTPALLGAGLLGGLVGAGVAILLPWLLPSLDSSAGQTAALEQRLGEMQQGAASRRALEALEARISAAGATATKAESEAAATARRLSELLAAAPAGPDAATLAPIAERARRAEALAASASESLAGRDKALEEAGRRIGDLAGRLATVEQTAKAVGAPSSAALAAARLVITSRIAQALEAGRPFAGDLRALSGGTGADRIDPARLAPLSAVAEKGAPSREALQGEFRRLRPALEQDTVSQSASLGERILKVLDGMVSVRPLGEQPGSSPLALTSLIERALASGDTAAAATAWKQLPEPARRASEAFGAGLAIRAAAIAAIRQLEDEAVAALGAGR